MEHEYLLVDGVKYKHCSPKSEDELESMIKEHTKDIFGKDSLYFDIKKKIKSKAGITSIPDGYVVSFTGRPHWHIVEVELSSHPLHEHVVPQISKFISGVRSLEGQKELINSLYNEIKANPLNEICVKEKIGSGEIYRFLSDLISNPPTLVLIIDKKSEELDEVCRSLPLNTKTIEFKTYEREGVGLAVHAHVFETLIEEKPAEEIVRKKEKPDFMKNWNARLNWVEPECRELVTMLIGRIEKEFPTITHRPSYRWYNFYNSSEVKKRNIFLTLMLTKKKIIASINVDPNKFQDEKRWTREVKGWFFERGIGVEKRFDIQHSTDINYALKLIRQSYNFSIEKEAKKGLKRIA